MGGLIWEQRAWTEVTAWGQRHVWGLQSITRLPTGASGYRTGSGADKNVPRWPYYFNVPCHPTHSEVLAHLCFLLLSYITLMWSLSGLSSTTAPAIFKGKFILYWSPGKNLGQCFVVEEYGGGYGIMAATLAFGALIQEPFFMNACLEFKRYFVCIISGL